MPLNLYTAWTCFLLGALAGAVPGLFFQGEQWLGGYGSWRRRLIRLGHISFFGIGALNLAFWVTCRLLGHESGLALPSVLLVVGAITMPLVCYLSAWKSFFRHIFFIPAGSVTIACLIIFWKIVL